jgi:hypothetical protein
MRQSRLDSGDCPEGAYMRRFNYALSIVALLILTAMPAVAQSILVSSDEWVFADGYINLPGTDDTQFADNVAQWLTGGPGSGGQVLILVSSSIGATYNTLATYLSGLGYNVVGPTTTVPSLATLLTYRAVYLAGEHLDFSSSNIPNYPALDAALVTYVNQSNNPGNVLIMAGTTCNDDLLWNGFLNAFGLSLAHACNDISNIMPFGPFGTQGPYGMALFGSVPPVNNIYMQNGNNVSTLGTVGGVQIFTFACTPALCPFVPSVINRLYGAWRPPCGHGPNVLQNGSFESGFTGWTQGGNFQFTQVVSGPFYAYSGAENGQFYAVLGPVGSDGSLSQDFATIPGADYIFSFCLNAIGDHPSDFSAFWDGTQVYSTTDPNTGGVWTQFSFHEIGTGFDTIGVTFRDDPAWIALDNVAVSKQ